MASFQMAQTNRPFADEEANIIPMCIRNAFQGMSHVRGQTRTSARTFLRKLPVGKIAAYVIRCVASEDGMPRARSSFHDQLLVPVAAMSQDSSDGREAHPSWGTDLAFCFTSATRPCCRHAMWPTILPPTADGAWLGPNQRLDVLKINRPASRPLFPLSSGIGPWRLGALGERTDGGRRVVAGWMRGLHVAQIIEQRPHTMSRGLRKPLPPHLAVYDHSTERYGPQPTLPALISDAFCPPHCHVQMSARP